MTVPPNSRLIPLTQGKFAIVDEEDFDALNKFKWYASKYNNTFYALRNSEYINGKRKVICMHRYIMSPKNKEVIDHINHNGIDNRRCNIRVCSQQENHMNIRGRIGAASKYKGVSFSKETTKWRARITINKKEVLLGYFSLEKDAAIAYDEAAMSFFEQFACLNRTMFPNEF